MPQVNRRRLTVLAPELPAMRCEKGCGECCGSVPVTRRKLDEVRAFIAERGITPRADGTRCPLFIRNQCAIYEIRPRVCQAYGHSEQLSCSRGHDRVVDDEGALLRWILGDGVPETTLHELVGMAQPVADVTARAIATRQRGRL